MHISTDPVHSECFDDAPQLSRSVYFLFLVVRSRSRRFSAFFDGMFVLLDKRVRDFLHSVGWAHTHHTCATAHLAHTH